MSRLIWSRRARPLMTARYSLPMAIRNQVSPMQYRAFGRGGPQISVVTLGGMRYPKGWDAPREELPPDMITACTAMTRAALAAGVNHIETAFGYGRSERCYGLVLNEILNVPRHDYWLMTKGDPVTADATYRLVEQQLKDLRTDHIDFYGWHGINNPQRLASACAPDGPVVALNKLRQQGVIGRVGFSTHAHLATIIDAIATGMFQFVNLHYYYFFQRHLGAVHYAGEKGLGVFIISPNDKGGQLFNPPASLRSLTAPLTPIQFNARWCLKHPEVSTLSFGMNDPAHIAEMLGIFPAAVPLTAADLAIQQRLDHCLAHDPESAWEGWECLNDPSGINIPEVLRFRRLLRCYGMEDFGRYRYNMLEAKGHWFPGGYATPEAIAQVDAARAPAGIDLPARLAETHAALHRPKPAQ